MLNPEHPNCTLEVWSGLVFSYRCSKRMDRHGVALSLHAAVSFQCKSGCRPSGPGFLETVDATRCDADLPPLILPSGLRRTCPSAVRRWAADMQAAEQRHLGASQLLRTSFHTVLCRSAYVGFQPAETGEPELGGLWQGFKLSHRFMCLLIIEPTHGSNFSRIQQSRAR